MTSTSWGPEVFERLYRERPDPWDLAASPYERDKYRATLDALPRARFGHALEIGCSIGVLTRLLAGRCDHLLAADFAEAALDQARRANADLPNVVLERRRMPGDWPAGRFDLILISEVLYFLDAGDVARTARAACDALEPGGAVLLVNWTGPTDTPTTGEAAAEGFIAACAGRVSPTRQSRAPLYRLDLLEG